MVDELKKRIFPIMFLVLLVGILSIQMVKAESFSIPVTEKSPNYKFVNLTDGNFELMFPNENETHYVNGTIQRSYAITLTAPMTISWNAASTLPFPMIHFGTPQDTDFTDECDSLILVCVMCIGGATSILDRLQVRLPITFWKTTIS